VVYAVCADEYDRLGSCGANRVADECGSGVQQVVVTSPRTSDRVDIQASEYPAARCAPIDAARAAHQYDTGVSASPCEQDRKYLRGYYSTGYGIDSPGTGMLEEEPAARWR